MNNTNNKMDAVEYLKVKARMIKAGDDALCGISCIGCPLYDENNGMNVNCEKLETLYPEKAVAIVEKWAKEHPKKTRQSKFLKMYPNATPFHISPCNIDADMAIDSKCKRKSCIECREEYWNQEVDDDK